MGKWIQLLDKALFVNGLEKKWVAIDGQAYFANFFTKKKSYTIGGKKVVGWYTRGGKRIPIFADGSKGGGWKAFGTQAEAEAFSKDSKVKDDVFHGTDVKNVKSIREGGFRENYGAFGKAVYMTDNLKEAGMYAKKHSNPALVKAKINVKNPLIVSESTFFNASETYGKGFAGFNKYLGEVKKKHDSIVVTDIKNLGATASSSGSKYYVLFNKKQVMAYK